MIESIGQIIDNILQIDIVKIGVLSVKETIIIINFFFFKTDHVLNIRNVTKQPIIYIRIFQKRRKSLIDSGVSIGVIAEHYVPKTCHI